MANRKRILTGDNPTGQLHIGHLVGALENRVKLQDDYETFIIIADMHAFAYPKYVSAPEIVSNSVVEVAMDNLAVGLDPKKSKIFNEASIPEYYQLATMFSMITTYARQFRNPTIKEEIRDKSLGDSYSMGFLNFPLLQVADILGVNADIVPVGEDQLPHLELTNEVAHKFNSTYGNVFKEIQPMIGRVKRLVGTDGNTKMTKSLNNAIYLADSEDQVKEKVMKMFTDPTRIHATDPGKVEGNPVFIYHDVFNKDLAEVEDLKYRYSKGTVGDVEVKKKLLIALNETLAPIREKRRYYEQHRDEVMDIILEGVKTVRPIVAQSLDKAKSAMKLL
jgi:tryptophanyl-tRNA synthetase